MPFTYRYRGVLNDRVYYLRDSHTSNDTILYCFMELWGEFGLFKCDKSGEPVARIRIKGKDRARALFEYPWGNSIIENRVKDWIYMDRDILFIKEERCIRTT